MQLRKMKQRETTLDGPAILEEHMHLHLKKLGRHIGVACMLREMIKYAINLFVITSTNDYSRPG